MEKLPNYFKSCRLRHGLKQKQMGKLLGNKCFNHVSKLERGIREPSLETVLIYEILFGIEPQNLMPKYHKQLRSTLLKRVQDQPYLFSDSNSLLLIKRRLSKHLITKPINNKEI